MALVDFPADVTYRILRAREVLLILRDRRVDLRRLRHRRRHRPAELRHLRLAEPSIDLPENLPGEKP